MRRRVRPRRAGGPRRCSFGPDLAAYRGEARRAGRTEEFRGQREIQAGALQSLLDDRESLQPDAPWVTIILFIAIRKHS